MGVVIPLNAPIYNPVRFDMNEEDAHRVHADFILATVLRGLTQEICQRVVRYGEPLDPISRMRLMEAIDVLQGGPP